MVTGNRRSYRFSKFLGGSSASQVRFKGSGGTSMDVRGVKGSQWHFRGSSRGASKGRFKGSESLKSLRSLGSVSWSSRGFQRVSGALQGFL